MNKTNVTKTKLGLFTPGRRGSPGLCSTSGRRSIALTFEGAGAPTGLGLSASAYERMNVSVSGFIFETLPVDSVPSLSF